MLDFFADDFSDIPLGYDEESDESNYDVVVNIKSIPLVISESDADVSANEDNTLAGN